MADVRVETESGDRYNTSYGSGDSEKMNSGIPFYLDDQIDLEKQRFPHCIVWTPIPILTWLFPIIGHMGIATNNGVIRDFAGPYYVSVNSKKLLVYAKLEDSMAFGNPTKYWQLMLERVPTGNRKETWDRCVHEASEVYKERMHNLCCDNCHSHVAMALNLMQYDKSTSWNMVKLCFLMLCHSKYVSFGGFLKTWLPFLIMVAIILVIILAIYV